MIHFPGIISIDKEKELDKIQHSFMVKTKQNKKPLATRNSGEISLICLEYLPLSHKIRMVNYYLFIYIHLPLKCSL